jgi:hypothetical protein
MARKTSKKRPQRKIKWAQIIFLTLGVLVALSMIISSIFVFAGAPPPVVPTLVP